MMNEYGEYEVHRTGEKYYVFRRWHLSRSKAYHEYDAKHLRNWLNERAAGYPTKLVLHDDEC